MATLFCILLYLLQSHQRTFLSPGGVRACTSFCIWACVVREVTKKMCLALKPRQRTERLRVQTIVYVQCSQKKVQLLWTTRTTLITWKNLILRSAAAQKVIIAHCLRSLPYEVSTFLKVRQWMTICV